MTLLQLRVLLAVARHGSFTAAADDIGMSQPAVSRAVAALENELGVVLLVRGRDGASLTEAGQRAVAHTREALRHLDLFQTDVAEAAGKLTGRLRLASMPSVTGTLVAARLREFTDRYPQVQTRLFEGSDQEIRDWLRQGAADVGVVALPAPGLRTATLGTDEMVVLVPEGHRLSERDTIGIDALVGQPFIFPTGGYGSVIMAAAHRAGVRLPVTFEARELTAILELVGAGLGVSVVPSLGLPTEIDGVVTRPLRPRIPRLLAIALGAGADSVPAARAFVDQVTDARPDQLTTF